MGKGSSTLKTEDIDKNHVSMSDVLDHYNIIGLGVAVALGVATKDLIFSLSDNIILPLIGRVVKTSFFKDYVFDGDKFASRLLTFALVIGIIFAILYGALRPMIYSTVKEEKKVINDVMDKFDTLIDYEKEIANKISSLKENYKPVHVPYTQKFINRHTKPPPRLGYRPDLKYKPFNISERFRNPPR